MVRINSINSVNNYQNKNKICFKGNNTQTNPQIEQLPDVSPDFAIKTPMAYVKTGEMEFPYGTKAYCYKLSNGQKVIIVPQEGETVLRSYVNTGSMNEPDKLRGISHYIEHNLFNGSRGLEQGDFFKQVDKMGASTNASTGFAETNYYISSNLINKDDLENKIKIHASMLETPLFAIDKLEKEKGIVNSEINMITSDPENLAINKMLKNLYGINSTSTDLIGGTTDNITNLTREDVVNYYNNNYYPSNMVTVITGEVNPDETIRLISKYFTSKKQPSGQRKFEKLTPIQKAVREDIISDKATASHIVVGFNGANAKNIKDRILEEAVIEILSGSATSRIDKKIKPYNTASHANEEKISSNPEDGRALIFTAESAEENSEKVLKIIFNEIANLANNPPTDDEMQIVKKRMLNNFSKIFEMSFATNNAIGTNILENNEDYLNNYEQIVKSITPQDIADAAKKYFDINKASVTVIHPSSASAESINKNYNEAKNISFTGREEAINPSGIKEYNMPTNNFRIITNNNKSDNCYVRMQFSTSGYNTDKYGSIILLSELLNEGTMSKKQEEFLLELQKSGIGTNFISTNKSIIVLSEFGAEDMDKALKSIKSVLDNPRFTQETFDEVKSRAIENITISEKSAFDKLEKEAYPNLPQGISKEELLQQLKTLTLDDVKNLYNTIMANAKASISITAPFDRKSDLNNTLFKNISDYKRFNVYQPRELLDKYLPNTQTKVLTDVDNKNQAEIIEAFKFRTSNNLKDEICIDLLNTILGGNTSSRLFNDLREQQKLAYHVNSNYDITDNIGLLYLRIGTTTENKDTNEISFDNVQKSIDGFNKHIQKIKTEKVSPEELNNAKLSLKNNILNLNNTSFDRNTSLSYNLDTPYGIFKDNEAFKIIDSITEEDILNTANYIFSDKPIYSIVATENTLKANESYLKSL